MRELKFRVYDKVNERYCTGIGIQNIFSSITRNNGEPSEIILNSALLSQYDIEQYTGLKDKNGKEVYEADIVSEHNGDIIGKIARSISGEWRIEWMGIFGGSSVLYDEISMCEVIGNVHKDEELLEEKKNGDKN